MRRCGWRAHHSRELATLAAQQKLEEQVASFKFRLHFTHQRGVGAPAQRLLHPIDCLERETTRFPPTYRVLRCPTLAEAPEYGSVWRIPSRGKSAGLGDDTKRGGEQVLSGGLFRAGAFVGRSR